MFVESGECPINMWIAVCKRSKTDAAARTFWPVQKIIQLIAKYIHFVGETKKEKKK